MCPAVGLDYESFGLVLDDFEVCYVTIKLSCVLSNELIAFPDLQICEYFSGRHRVETDLRLGIRFPEYSFDRFHDTRCVLAGSAL